VCKLGRCPQRPRGAQLAPAWKPCGGVRRRVRWAIISRVRLRFLLVALDSADPDLLLQWSADGTLPTLAALQARGAHARLTGPETVSAHGVWTSIWSGVSLSRHGRYLPRPLRTGSYDLAAVEGVRDAALPFWNALTQQTIAILDAPDARPVPGLNGPQLLGWGSHPSPSVVRSEPRDLAAEVARRLGPRIVSDETQGSRTRDGRVLDELLKRVQRQGRVARHLLDGCDGAVIGFGDAHAAGHRFWKYGPRATTQIHDERLSHALRDVYVAVDEEIGRILATLAADTHVAVLSNHGIREGYPTDELMQAFCHRLGYQVAHDLGPVAAGRRAVGEHWDRVAARLWRGHRGPARDGLAGTDWDRTRVFAIPGFYTGFLRVNLRGREPRGVVDRADYTTILDDVEANLRQVVDAATGEPAVERITRTMEAFGGGIPQQLPDVFVEWRLASSPCARHPRATLQRRRLGVPRANMHSRTGIAFVAGPAVQARGDAGELSPIDLAPLFRGLAGAVPADSAQPAIRAFALTEAS
jgi:predicted AlkP superfamily phosphohydrolase/phosphomutase